MNYYDDLFFGYVWSPIIGLFIYLFIKLFQHISMIKKQRGGKIKRHIL